jgi:site-specific recombinase XerD
VLRHTVCTHPADAGDVGTSRRLAGRADTRTTTIYIAVSDARLEHTIAERTRQRNRLRRAATAD